jgi:hypothetical protein
MNESPLEALAVRTIAGAQAWSLLPDLVTLPATTIIVEVTGHRSHSVTLDGERHRLTPGRTGLLSLDLTRSTGYHRLVVDREPFWFATEDGKLKLAGIEEMLNYLLTAGTGWTGQAIFSDGTGLRDTHVVYAWLDQWADLALRTIEQILSNPRFRTTTSKKLSRRGGSGVLRAQTIQLLKGSPREYLASSPTGLIQIGNERYDPLRVVARQRRRTIDTPAHRRIAALLDQLSGLVREVLVNTENTSVRARCRGWLAKLDPILGRPILGAIHPAPGAMSAPRQQEELIDREYRTCYEISRDLHHRLAWSANHAPMRRYSYVQRSDSIYQAFAACSIAGAFGLTQTSPLLGAESPAFTGPDFDLYFDVTPPSAVLRSWRASSDRPDLSRPDLILHERSSGRVALMDAKYRIGPDGEASEDSRKDVSAYMALYGLDAISILYPGNGTSVRSVTGQGHAILEVPIRPWADLPSVLAEAATAIRGTLQSPPY